MKEAIKHNIVKNQKLGFNWFLIVILSLFIVSCRGQSSKPIDGLCFSPFRNSQSPDLGIFPSRNEIIDDIIRIIPLTDNVRTYGTDHTLFDIPALCDSLGVNCYPGAWLSSNGIANIEQVSYLLQIANQKYKTTKGLIAGNEVLLSNDLPEDSLIKIISTIKLQTNIPVSTAETWSNWLNHPNLVINVDFIALHVHPYWEGISVESAANYVLSRYQQVKNAYPGKEVIIFETGWPSAGETFGNSVPGIENQQKFVKEFIKLAKQNDVKYFLFEVFDEEWKGGTHQEEKHWGIFYSDRSKKQIIDTLMKSGISENPSMRFSFNVSTNLKGDILFVNLNSINNLCEIKVFDIFGHVILNQHVNSGINAIDIRNFRSGIYIIQLSNNESIINKKLVIQ